MQLLSLLLAAAPLLALADRSFEQSARRRAAHTKRHVAPRNSAYKLVDLYEGQSFFDGFEFFTAADPTGGQVTFVNRDTATKSGLAYVQSDNVTVLGVDSTTWLDAGKPRNSVRIQSKKQYSQGLFVADMFDVPHGCGTWPAYWTVGPNWPTGGEIDVFEVTHHDTTNQVAFHTGAGCSMNKNPKQVPTSAKVNSTQAFTGSVFNDKCASSNDDNSGCGMRDADTRSAGHGFNMNAGGVYAHAVDASGVRVWFFARGEIPADIVARNPDPSGWPLPVAFLAADGCDIPSHFYDHSIIFDITLCGGFGAATYAKSGCPGTCADAVRDPTNFARAQFKIASVAVYDKQ